jgi:sucrose-6-phosphate hydrolase SacC (GH32 family)
MLKRSVIAAVGLLAWGGNMAGLCQDRKPYAEPYRPQVHFSPRENWTNDPNGLVYFDGEYHLFFQYNPFGDKWGHMSWGHAVSSDLLHWKELPVALPEHDGEMIFTGSVVVDEHNTSGLCKDGKPCMVAVYTSHRPGNGREQRESQSIASSQDRGRTWQFYAGNPVLDLDMADFRDPNVSWNDQIHRWVMAVALPNEHKVAFYTSADLKQWAKISTFGPEGATGGQWECPDLLEVPAEGGKKIWALKVGINPGALQGGSGEQYFLGNFDGHEFHSLPGTPVRWTDYGKDSYCAISFNHLPPGEKPTLLGWMSNWQYADKLPTQPWRGQMTLPRRVVAVKDGDSFVLSEDPVIASLHDGPARMIGKQLAPKEEAAELLSSESPMEIQLTFAPADAEKFGVRLYSDDSHWTEIGFDTARHVVYTNRLHAGVSPGENFLVRTEAAAVATRPWNLKIVIDHSSVEVFAQDGTIAMTNLVLPPTSNVKAVAFRKGGTKAVAVSGRSWRLNSIWTSVQEK